MVTGAFNSVPQAASRTIMDVPPIETLRIAKAYNCYASLFDDTNHELYPDFLNWMQEGAPYYDFSPYGCLYYADQYPSSLR